ncbi:dihydroorotate dehydrogenase (quinone), mitochondrial isoform X2 [Patella vulgata]|uniref:dihydroorotate dehydrogenase (quinone), mitochondrial isoform X2 n=1 Tax=Patella vulgata TaxID=6465 RepID=UPI00217FFBE2|nr:dihydroorotate dehydrogenase (quinone), mitochondrial isoform X2 [Patella vulgata]
MSGASNSSVFVKQLKQMVVVCGGGTLTFFGFSLYRGDAKFYENMVMPAMRLLDAETAHNLAIKMAKYKLVPRQSLADPPLLQSKLWGKTFTNPVGLAAGFDKHGEAVDGLLKMGFGFVEVGSITPAPQEGNPKPRVFRLVEDRGVINRYGFNSDGHEVVVNRLRYREDEHVVSERGIMGINLGKNKFSSYPVEDYAQGVKRFGKLADYLVINVSSPNTPGLRAMQGRKQLEELLEKVSAERDKLRLKEKVPLLVKIAPDLSAEDKNDIAAVVSKNNSGVDGLIVSNTTVSRPPSLQNKHKEEIGGLSGDPLKHLSTSTISDMYKLTKGKIPIIGVGGISNGKDAYEKIKAGASLVQLYTALIYQGPPVVKKVKRELAQYLESDGYSNVEEAIGANHR